MSEIEKMMQNAGVKKLLYCDICRAQEHALGLCAETKCEPFYPPFTAGKQLSLIKWLCEHTYRNYIIFEYLYKIDSWRMECNLKEVELEGSFEECFKECVAYLLNDRWQDLTEQERTEIRSILNG